jgi:hypothetical protein
MSTESSIGTDDHFERTVAKLKERMETLPGDACVHQVQSLISHNSGNIVGGDQIILQQSPYAAASQLSRSHIRRRLLIFVAGSVASASIMIAVVGCLLAGLTGRQMAISIAIMSLAASITGGIAGAGIMSLINERQPGAGERRPE